MLIELDDSLSNEKEYLRKNINKLKLLIDAHVNGFHYLHIDFRLPNAIISSIVCGLSVAYSQFYIERKKGMCKSFWIVAGIFTIMAFVMILMIR